MLLGRLSRIQDRCCVLPPRSPPSVVGRPRVLTAFLACWTFSIMAVVATSPKYWARTPDSLRWLEQLQIGVARFDPSAVGVVIEHRLAKCVRGGGKLPIRQRGLIGGGCEGRGLRRQQALISSRVRNVLDVGGRHSIRVRKDRERIFEAEI